MLQLQGRHINRSISTAGALRCIEGIDRSGWGWHKISWRQPSHNYKCRKNPDMWGCDVERIWWSWESTMDCVPKLLVMWLGCFWLREPCGTLTHSWLRLSVWPIFSGGLIQGGRRAATSGVAGARLQRLSPKQWHHHVQLQCPHWIQCKDLLRHIHC